LIDAKQKGGPGDVRIEQLQRLARELHITLGEIEKRVQKLEDIKTSYGRSMAEYYKRELINVRVKYDKPIMRWAFDQVEPQVPTGGARQKKKRKAKKKE